MGWAAMTIISGGITKLWTGLGNRNGWTMVMLVKDFDFLNHVLGVTSSTNSRASYDDLAFECVNICSQL